MSGDLPKRKKLRLPGYDYKGQGHYFVTICTHEKRPTLGTVVGADVLIGPHVVLSEQGIIVDEILSQMHAVEKYVVMPNHIHIIFRIPDRGDGPMGTSAPTVPGLVRYLKRRVTQVCGKSIWQRSYYDHILRDEGDYLRVWCYMDENPAKWQEDEYCPTE